MFIYGLYSGQLVLYIGKTTSLKKREIKHRSSSNHTSSKYIPAYIDWEIRLLEECEESQGTLREQYWFDSLKPLYNMQRPGQTLKEYQQTETRKELQRKYQQTEACKEYHRKYQQTEAAKEYQRKYNQTEAYKEYQRKYQQTEAYKEYKRKYQQTEAYKEYQRKYYQKKRNLNLL